MRTSEIATLVHGELSGDGEVAIDSVADITSAAEGQLAFFDKNASLPQTAAACVLVRYDAEILDETSPACVIRVRDPKLAFARAAAVLSRPAAGPPGRHATAFIAESSDVRAASIGAFVSVGPRTIVGDNSVLHAGSRIGANVSIGERTVIHPNCVIYDNVTIGSGCVVHAGAVIGADGFGYVKAEDGTYQKFPQIGTVVVEDNVEIGANTCIDRGALGETRIGEGTKIDNLVQVGHNVVIGKRCVIAAQTGISGSVVIEDDCVIGGQVGFGDHVRVQSGAVIGSQAGVLPGKIVRPGIWWGTPIQPLDEFKRQNAHVKGLARLRADVKDLRARLDRKTTDPTKPPGKNTDEG